MQAGRWIVTAAACLLVASSASAQAVAGAASTASATAPGARPGARGPMGPRHGMGGRWGPDVTPGWSMMTPAERRDHQARMQSMTDYADCRAYMDEHHQEMVKRAAASGVAGPMQPRHDACARLKR